MQHLHIAVSHHDTPCTTLAKEKGTALQAGTFLIPVLSTNNIDKQVIQPVGEGEESPLARHVQRVKPQLEAATASM